MGVFIEDEIIDRRRREGVGRGCIAMRVPDHQSSVGAANGDQVNTRIDMRALLGLELDAQGLRSRQFRIAEIADHAEVGHDGRQTLVEAFRPQAHHMELAAGQIIVRETVGVQSREVVARADDDRLSLNRPAAGLELWRRRGVDRGLTQKGDAEALAEPGGEPRDRVARFDARLMRAIERAGEFVRAQTRPVVGQFARLDEPALGAHLGFKERLDDRARLGAPRNREQPALNDRDLRGVGDFEPDLERSLRAPPACPRLLAGHRDEAEVPDRSAVRLRVPVDHDDALATPGGGERMRQPANACADDRDIVGLHCGRHSSNGALELNSRGGIRLTLAP